MHRGGEHISNHGNLISVLQVSWMLQSDNFPLTIGKFVFSPDIRIQVNHVQNGDIWKLEILNAKEEDSGIYLCHINHRGDEMTYRVQLNVKLPVTTQFSEPEAVTTATEILVTTARVITTTETEITMETEITTAAGVTTGSVELYEVTTEVEKVETTEKNEEEEVKEGEEGEDEEEDERFFNRVIPC